MIAPLLPNTPRGVPRVDDRRVLNGIGAAMIEGLFFLLDVFFVVYLAYWVRGTESSLGGNSRGLFRWSLRANAEGRKFHGEHRQHNV